MESLPLKPLAHLEWDRLSGEVHERLSRSGSSEGCTSGCAKLASPPFSHSASAWALGTAACASSRALPSASSGAGQCSQASQTPLLGPPAGAGRKAAEMCPECRMAWRSGLLGCIRWKELASLQKTALGGSRNPEPADSRTSPHLLPSTRASPTAPPPPRRAAVSRALPPPHPPPHSLQRR